LKEVEALEKLEHLDAPMDLAVRWDKALKSASAKLEQALALSGSQVDLSSRLGSRIAILKDEASKFSVIVCIRHLIK
jgi:hypothetical protein